MTNISKMQMEYQLTDYAKHGNIVNIQKLIEKEGISPAVHNNQAFWWAANKGYLNIIKLLIKDSRVSPAARKNAAIITASEMGHADVVALLLADKRVNPSENGNIAVHSAARNGHYDVVELLVADERVDPSDANNTAIRRASANGYLDIVQLLLAYAANISPRKFDEMYQAAANGFIGSVSQEARDYLVNKDKVRAVAINHAEIIANQGFTACCRAIRNAHNRRRNYYNSVAKITNTSVTKKANNSVMKNFEAEKTGWEILSTVIGSNVVQKANLSLVQ